MISRNIHAQFLFGIACIVTSSGCISAHSLRVTGNIEGYEPIVPHGCLCELELHPAGGSDARPVRERPPLNAIVHGKFDVDFEFRTQFQDEYYVRLDCPGYRVFRSNPFRVRSGAQELELGDIVVVPLPAADY